MLLNIAPQLLYSYNDFSSADTAVIIGIVIGAIIGIGIAVVIGVFYCLTLQNTLKAISPVNRKMEPGQVWLLFIPIFNLVWHFFVVSRMADSIENEYRSRGAQVDSRPAYSIGLAYCILSLCGWVPFLGSFAGIASLICFIIYWVKINDYKNKLMQLPPVGSEESTIF